MKKSSRVVSTLLLGATVASASTGVFAVESKEIIKEKLAGETRFETAVEVSNKFGKADTVVLVNYTGIADALAATPLAKMKNAPILLTEAGSLTKATADQIAKLEAKKVIVIGGETAVSKNVVKQLEELKLDVERVAGEDRYATSEAVANEMGKDGKVEKVAVVNGIKGLADALSVAAPAAKEGMAIVLSDGTSVRAGQKVLDEAKTKYVIGGETVVTKELTEKLGAERLAGANRNATNAEVLNKFYDAKELDKVYVAKDGAAKENQLVDALAAGPLAGKEGNPLVLAGSELDKAQEAYLKDRIAKSLVEVGEGINQNTVSAIVKALTVKEETPNENSEVTGVEVLNANQIEVKFSKAVDKDSAEEISNYEIKKDENGQKLIPDNSNAKAEVQEDGKTVIITLPQDYLAEDAKFFNQETIRVKIENVMTENKGEVFDKYENKKVKFFDNTLPELKEVKQVGPADFDLVFSEPVTAKSASEIVSATRIDNGAYSFKAETRVNNSTLKSNVVRISTSTDVEEGTHTLTIKENKIYDYAGLKLEAVEKKFEAKESKEDLTASVYKTSSDTVTVQFNKEVENAETVGEDANSNVKYYLDYENKDYVADKAEMKNGKLEISFDREISTGDHKILVVYGNEKKDKIQDLWENELATKEIAFTVAKDTVAPTATVSYNKDDKKIEIKYSKKVEKSEAEKGSNYILKDEKGNIKSIESKLERKNGNQLIYRIDAKNLSGKYTLTIKGDKIHDTSVEKNAVKEEIFKLDTLDSKAPLVTSVRYGGDKVTNFNKIYVEFSEDMKTEGEGSILDETLYNLSYKDDKNESINKTLNEIEDAKIELNGNNSVIITLPDALQNGKISEGSDKIEIKSIPEVKIGRVCDANGNFAKLNGIEIAEGKDNSKFVVTNANGIVAKADSEIELINGSQIDDADALEKGCNVNSIDKNKVELYVIGNVSSVVGDSIKITDSTEKTLVNKCTEAKHNVVSLKVQEGQYIQATKLTLKFENKVELEKIIDNTNKLKFEAGALTTAIGTDSAEFAPELKYGKEADKKVVKYEDDSAKIFVDGNNVATKVQFTLTTAVQGVNPDTFAVDGYTVKTVTGNGTNVITLNLDKNGYCTEVDGEADINVDLVNPIFNTNGDKTESIDQFQIERVVKEMQLSDKKDAIEGTQQVSKVKIDNIATENGDILVGDTIVGLTKETEDDATKVAEKIRAAVSADAKSVWNVAIDGTNLDTLVFTAKTPAKNVEKIVDCKSTGVVVTETIETEGKETIAAVANHGTLTVNKVPNAGSKLVVGDKIVEFKSENKDNKAEVIVVSESTTIDEVATKIQAIVNTTEIEAVQGTDANNKNQIELTQINVDANIDVKFPTGVMSFSVK
ncbi:cell wall-binding repeat-containing protein [Clostridium senegalense]|uniref:Cell wall-binding repeat-containing protein n=1 Tax=Clostridium senegalense TaxID=1465809 RepID=A0A6M0H1Q3_9CLOT|nr:cell wall-binding repeat-containing protein [Clostridium senegalense]NEU04666.1 cell wall-binding repeat-containing protein [Clostridium senegalense]